MDKIILKFHTTNQKRKIAYKKIESELTNRPGVIFLGGLVTTIAYDYVTFKEDDEKIEYDEKEDDDKKSD